MNNDLPTIYIAGPMSPASFCVCDDADHCVVHGSAENPLDEAQWHFNYPAFHEAKEQLNAVGFPVRNPATGQVDGWGWTDYVRHTLKMLLTCDAVALLPGWEKSRGARVEYFVADALDMPIKPLGEWLSATDGRLL